MLVHLMTLECISAMHKLIAKYRHFWYNR